MLGKKTGVLFTISSVNFELKQGPEPAHPPARVRVIYFKWVTFKEHVFEMVFQTVLEQLGKLFLNLLNSSLSCF